MGYKLTRLHRSLLEAVEKACRERGIKTITKEICFDNNEVYEFLKLYKKSEEESRKTRIIVRYAA